MLVLFLLMSKNKGSLFKLQRTTADEGGTTIHLDAGGSERVAASKSVPVVALENRLAEVATRVGTTGAFISFSYQLILLQPHIPPADTPCSVIFSLCWSIGKLVTTPAGKNVPLTAFAGKSVSVAAAAAENTLCFFSRFQRVAMRLTTREVAMC